MGYLVMKEKFSFYFNETFTAYRLLKIISLFFCLNEIILRTLLK